MLFIARVTLYPPITVTLNGLLLVAIGFATTRFLPGRKLIKLALLLLIPLAGVILWQGESEPGFQRLDHAILVVAGILVLGGGIAGCAKSQSNDFTIE
ncbi:hypothetical protein [Lentisalinibacter orientalis]|uniref:hypothetical protein n=1 Tax=Lentisalinibacter orientalis TaxID=2992241 RepID=UPI003864B8A6